MANDRLKAAMTDAGLDDEQLADLAAVDVKTVGRWVSGRIPHARHRLAVARALRREQRWLWPGADVGAPAQDARREIVGAYSHANDLLAPDWRLLLKGASELVELLDYTLTDILTTAGTVAQLAAKAAAGVRIKILIAGKDSLWVAELARELGQEVDRASQTQVQREIDLARAHLQPLLDTPGVRVSTFYAPRTYSILRFDEQMLVTMHLPGRAGSQAPLLHLRRSGDDGLFDQFAAHLNTIFADASEPLAPDPDHYPDPGNRPDRYQAVITETYGQDQPQPARQAANDDLSNPEYAFVRRQLANRNDRQPKT